MRDGVEFIWVFLSEDTTLNRTKLSRKNCWSKTIPLILQQRQNLSDVGKHKEQ